MTDVPTRLLRDRLRERLRDGTAAPPSPACLDAERLAAWADDALSPAQQASVESHAADCARCQALLAAMAQSAPAAAAAVMPWWRRRAVGWLVPLAATAAGLALWVSVSAPRRAIPAASASLPSQSVGVPPNDRPTVSQPPSSSFDASSQRTLVDQLAAANEPPGAPAAAAPASPGELRREAARKTTRAPAATSAPMAAAEPAITAPADATAAPPPGTRETVAGAAPRASPAAPLADRRAQEPLSAGSESNVAALRQESALARNRLAAPSQIVSATGSARWRIVPNGGVERSSDGGATWQAQATGVDVTLTAGAAPSPSVCWLVGPRGVVLLSTDGRSWHRLVFPETIDLTSVRAADANQATVTAIDGRSFSTTDGGVTWTR